MADKFDLNVIRVALEHATFADFRIRDAINTIIKATELDLEEVGFEASDNLKETVEQLENILSDIEAPRKTRAMPLELVESEVEGVKEKKTIDDIDDENAPKVVNVDEELNESGF